jgi:hypothetical protein
MAVDNVFEGDQEYLIQARDAISLLEDLKDQQEEAKLLQKKNKKALNQEEKSINDEISATLKRRKDQIAGSYDRQIDVNNSKIRQVQVKKDKKKSQRMETRIARETAGIREENRQLHAEVNTLFKQNHVPSFCNSGFYYSLFSPKGLKEFLNLLLMVLIFCVCIPAIVIEILLYTSFSEGNHAAACVLIAALIIIFEFIIYFIIFNITKVKHRDCIIEGRRTRDKILANEKAMKAIKNSISKDKDESIYKLGKYDNKIKELEAAGDDISSQKLEALSSFEKETKQMITDEINGRRKDKLDKLKDERDSIEARITDIQEKIANLELEITDKYETYLGKDFCTEERLSDLISLMEEGSAGTVSEAIKIYKGDDK